MVSERLDPGELSDHSSGRLGLCRSLEHQPNARICLLLQLFNERTAEYALTAPNGNTVHGSSLEWVVERPSLGTTLTSLTNYISSPWSEGIGWNYAAESPTYYYMGDNPTFGTLEQITMYDNNGDAISAATIENFNFLWFQNFGSACGLANAPPC